MSPIIMLLPQAGELDEHLYDIRGRLPNGLREGELHEDWLLLQECEQHVDFDDLNVQIITHNKAWVRSAPGIILASPQSRDVCCGLIKRLTNLRNAASRCH